MQFKEDAPVIHEGDDLGRLARVIIDPQTMQISDLVVHELAYHPKRRSFQSQW